MHVGASPRGGQRLKLRVIPNRSLLNLLKQDFLLSTELTDSASLANQLALQGVCLYLLGLGLQEGVLILKLTV